MCNHCGNVVQCSDVVCSLMKIFQVYFVVLYIALSTRTNQGRISPTIARFSMLICMKCVSVCFDILKVFLQYLLCARFQILIVYDLRCSSVVAICQCPKYISAHSSLNVAHQTTKIPRSAMRVLVAQCLEHLTGNWKVMGLIPIWGSENSFTIFHLPVHNVNPFPPRGSPLTSKIVWRQTE